MCFKPYISIPVPAGTGERAFFIAAGRGTAGTGRTETDPAQRTTPANDPGASPSGLLHSLAYGRERAP
jgi:hypothetical protein